MTKWLTILFCAVVSTWQYATVALATCATCATRMAQIVNGTDVQPYSFRVLTPSVIVALGNTPLVFALFHFGMLLVFFALLWAWVNRWGGEPLAAVALVTIALSVMYPTYYFSVYTITEWVLWLCGLHFLSRSVPPTAK